MPNDAHPIAPADRIVAIDIVRGIALFGVMAINVTTEFRVSIFEQFLHDRIDGGWLDRALHSFLMIGIDLKAFALFSLLFGVGLAIQHDHLSHHPQRITLLLRRLVFLMLFGAVHLLLVWNGDILFEYAIAGFIVVPLLFGPSRLPATVGLALLVVFLASPFLPPIATMPSRSWMTQIVAEATRVYGSGGFADVLAFRIRELPGLLPLHLFMFPRTVALMLIGSAVWRAGLFQMGSRASRQLPLAAPISLGCGAALAAIQAVGLLHLEWRGQLSLERLGTVLLAFGYVAVIIWASDKASARSLLAWAAPLGRMAFTNYVMQSVIFGWLFYGYGSACSQRSAWQQRWLSAPLSMPHRPSSVRSGCFTIASDRWNGCGAARCTVRGSRFGEVKNQVGNEVSWPKSRCRAWRRPVGRISCALDSCRSRCAAKSFCPVPIGGQFLMTEGRCKHRLWISSALRSSPQNSVAAIVFMTSR